MSDARIISREFLTEFIELYKSLPAVWKIKSKEYTNRIKKNEAYRLLVEKLREVEPDATRDTVTKKINSLRSSRRKEKKKVEDSLKSSSSAVDIYHPTLWYYDLLGFVDEQETTRVIFVDSVESDDMAPRQDPVYQPQVIRVESARPPPPPPPGRFQRPPHDHPARATAIYRPPRANVLNTR